MYIYWSWNWICKFSKTIASETVRWLKTNYWWSNLLEADGSIGEVTWPLHPLRPLGLKMGIKNIHGPPHEDWCVDRVLLCHLESSIQGLQSKEVQMLKSILKQMASDCWAIKTGALFCSIHTLLTCIYSVPTENSILQDRMRPGNQVKWKQQQNKTKKQQKTALPRQHISTIA